MRKGFNFLKSQEKLSMEIKSTNFLHRIEGRGKSHSTWSIAAYKKSA